MMGITSNEIAAQRAMLARGEQKRRAAKQAEERERLRDTFAAAALTGLLADDGDRVEYAMPSFTARAYEWADAMLREREESRTGKNAAETVQEVEKCTERENDHDAVPEARAKDADRGRSDKAVTRPGDSTGNTPSPESYEQGDEKRVNTTANRGIDRAAYEGDIVSRLRNWRGLHLAHGGKLFDEAADEIERLRAAIRRLADQDATLSVQGGSVTVTMDATLTDAEREAVAGVAASLHRLSETGIGHGACRELAEQAATLRKLLERLT